MRLAPLASLVLLAAACGSTATAPAPAEAAVPGLAVDRVAGGSPTLVFLHGWAGDRTYWARQLLTFGGRHEVLAVDLAGHGDTTVVHDPWTMLGEADEVVQLLERSDLDDVVLVGHSMGGVVALEVARRAPGRVRAVVGVDTLHDADFRWPEEAFEAVVARYEADWEGTMREFVQGMFASSKSPEVADYVIERALANPRGPLLALVKDGWSVDQEELFRAAGVPIRCINAAGSSVPTDVEGNRRLADFDVRLMEGVGHYPMLEDPDAFDALLAETLAELSAR